MYANNLRYESNKSSDSAYSVTLAKKAVIYYNLTNSIYPLYPETYYKLASTYRYNLKDDDKAEANLKHALKLDSAYFNASFELAKLYLDKRDFKKSFEYFGKTYSINPKDSLTLFYYAQIATAVGDMNTTYKLNKEFIQLYPALQYPYLNMGKYYSQTLKDDSAVIYFEKAIELGARSPELLNLMVSYYDKNKNQEKANHFRGLLK